MSVSLCNCPLHISRSVLLINVILGMCTVYRGPGRVVLISKSSDQWLSRPEPKIPKSVCLCAVYAHIWTFLYQPTVFLCRSVCVPLMSINGDPRCHDY